jgi:uroporphyrin-III C-methyltransferase
MKGKVFLIGAGPGDIDLLTLKAVKAIEQADVILIDDLANQDVLQFSRSDAEIIYVGKRGNCKSTPQSEIQNLLETHATRGKRVARIKGGDPFIFGRGGEEVLALRTVGIEIEVVAGITAGIAAAHSIGTPLTHRDYAHGITFVTGHSKEGSEPNWRALAQCETTLVIYMGMRTLESIVDELLDGGMRSDTAAAVVQSATLPEERYLITSLDKLVDDVQSNHFESPSIVIIGNVVSMSYLSDIGITASLPLLEEVT